MDRGGVGRAPPRRVRGRRGVAVALAAAPGQAQAEGTDTVTVRGHVLTVHTYGARGGRPIVVSSGDGGWIHLGPARRGNPRRDAASSSSAST